MRADDRRSLALEGRTSRQREEERGTDLVDVARFSDRLTRELFRRGIGNAGNDARVRRFGCRTAQQRVRAARRAPRHIGQTEVEEPDAAHRAVRVGARAGGEHDVRWRDVAVDDATGVRGAGRVEDGGEDGHGIHDGQWPALSYVIGESDALDELHRNPCNGWITRRETRVVDLRDVRLRDRLRSPHFFEERLPGDRSDGQMRVQQLHGHAAPVPCVIGFEDGGRAAASPELPQVEPFGDEAVAHCRISGSTGTGRPSPRSAPRDAVAASSCMRRTARAAALSAAERFS